MESTPQGVCGFFCITRLKDDGTEEVLLDWKQNLITNYGLENLCNAELPTGIAVGTGNPSNISKTGTSLANQVAEQTFTGHDGGFAQDSASGEFYYWFMANVTFPDHQAIANKTLTEVGFLYPDTANSLYTWAEISPAITPGPDDSLRIWYEIRFYQTEEPDQTGTESIKGQTTNYTARQMGIGTAQSPNGTLPEGFYAVLTTYGSAASLAPQTATGPDSNGDQIGVAKDLVPTSGPVTISNDTASKDVSLDVGSDVVADPEVHIITVEAMQEPINQGTQSPAATLPTALQVAYNPGFELKNSDVLTVKWTHKLSRYTPTNPEPRT